MLTLFPTIFNLSAFHFVAESLDKSGNQVMILIQHLGELHSTLWNNSILPLMNFQDKSKAKLQVCFFGNVVVVAINHPLSSLASSQKELKRIKSALGRFDENDAEHRQQQQQYIQHVRMLGNIQSSRCFESIRQFTDAYLKQGTQTQECLSVLQVTAKSLPQKPPEDVPKLPKFPKPSSSADKRKSKHKSSKRTDETDLPLSDAAVVTPSSPSTNNHATSPSPASSLSSTSGKSVVREHLRLSTICRQRNSPKTGGMWMQTHVMLFDDRLECTVTETPSSSQPSGSTTPPATNVLFVPTFVRCSLETIDDQNAAIENGMVLKTLEQLCWFQLSSKQEQTTWHRELLQLITPTDASTTTNVSTTDKKKNEQQQQQQLQPRSAPTAIEEQLQRELRLLQEAQQKARPAWMKTKTDASEHYQSTELIRSNSSRLSMYMNELAPLLTTQAEATEERNLPAAEDATPQLAELVGRTESTENKTLAAAVEASPSQPVAEPQTQEPPSSTEIIKNEVDDVVSPPSVEDDEDAIAVEEELPEFPFDLAPKRIVAATIVAPTITPTAPVSPASASSSSARILTKPPSTIAAVSIEPTS
jgi:hypothetical protein